MPKNRTCKDCERENVYLDPKTGRPSRVCSGCYAENVRKSRDKKVRNTAVFALEWGRSHTRLCTKPCKDCGRPKKDEHFCKECDDANHNVSGFLLDFSPFCHSVSFMSSFVL